MQEIIVYVFVGLSLFWAIRYVIKCFRKKGRKQCESCDACPLKQNCLNSAKENSHASRLE